MAIKKKIGGLDTLIANVSVTDHNQLENREAYGCHPISAIRKLPEKLTDIKNRLDIIEEEGTPIKQYVDDQDTIILNSSKSYTNSEIDNAVSNIELKADRINLVEADGELTFTNYKNEATSFRSGNEVDNDTIILNTEEKIEINKVYVDATLSGSGTSLSPLHVVLEAKEDNVTIVRNVNGELEVNGLLDTENIGTPLTASTIKDNISSISTNISNINSLNDAQNSRLVNIENDLNNRGGFLNAYDFGTTTPTQQNLTDYALQDLGVVSIENIPNKIRVKNLNNNIVWIANVDTSSIPATINWINNGIDNIAIANYGIAGIVKSSVEDYEVSVSYLGHMSVNGLSDLDVKVNSIELDVNDLKNENKIILGWSQTNLDLYGDGTIPTRLDNSNILSNYLINNNYNNFTFTTSIRDAEDFLAVPCYQEFNGLYVDSNKWMGSALLLNPNNIIENINQSMYSLMVKLTITGEYVDIYVITKKLNLDNNTWSNTIDININSIVLKTGNI